jgi:hypothetical protein
VRSTLLCRCTAVPCTRGECGRPCSVGAAVPCGRGECGHVERFWHFAPCLKGRQVFYTYAYAHLHHRTLTCRFVGSQCAGTGTLRPRSWGRIDTGLHRTLRPLPAADSTWERVSPLGVSYYFLIAFATLPLRGSCSRSPPTSSLEGSLTLTSPCGTRVPFRDLFSCSATLR